MTSVAEALPKFISSGGNKKFKKKNAGEQIFVVKIKCLPYGFFEKELWGYFNQFGKVIRARVARSKKTGNHKGWAYVGFGDKDVAEVAAETMNGYLMFEKKLLCHVMNKAPKCMLAGPRFVKPPHMKGQAKKDAENRNKAEVDADSYKKKREKALEKAAEKLRALGVDYDLSAVPSYTVSVKAPPAADEESIVTAEPPAKTPKKTKGTPVSKAKKATTTPAKKTPKRK